MLLALVSLKGIGMEYISYEELKKAVLISGCLLQEKKRMNLLVLEVQGIITDKGKKQDLLVQYLSDKLFSTHWGTPWRHTCRGLCIVFHYVSVDFCFFSSTSRWTLFIPHWEINDLFQDFWLVWLNLTSQWSLGSMNLKRIWFYNLPCLYLSWEYKKQQHCKTVN